MEPSQLQQQPQTLKQEVNHEMQDVSAAPPLPFVPPPTRQPPLSDLEIAAQYAELEIRSVAEQFAGTSVVGVPQPSAVAVKRSVDAAVVHDDDDDSDDSDDSETEVGEAHSAASASSSSDDDDDDDDDVASRNKLRAEIEAAMEREENKAAGPLKTANEVAVIPVREPSVELAVDCPIARCGTILNVSVPGLMLTIKSDLHATPLDEESVLCLEDRTVLGCIDEVFGPVMMPMYLVRFESAAKMPPQATINTVVYYATEHTTYIVPEQIKDKGTDASNIFDEETDEPVYSDDEAESAAKRQNRKRNRGGYASQSGDDSTATRSVGDRSSANVADYRHSSSRGGRESSSTGAGQGGSGGGRGSGSSYASHAPAPAPTSTPTPIQSQSHGGQTFYTQPGFAAPAPPPPPPPMGYAVQPMGYAQPPIPYSHAPMNPHHHQQQHGYHQPQHFHPAPPPQQQQFQQPPMPAYAPPMPGQQQFYHHPQPPMPPHQAYHGAPASQYPPQASGYYPPVPPQPQPPLPPLPPGPYNQPKN